MRLHMNENKPFVAVALKGTGLFSHEWPCCRVGSCSHVQVFLSPNPTGRTVLGFTTSNSAVN